MTTQTTSTVAVRVEGLDRRFRGTEALRNVNLTIPVGSVFGLIGLNGAGKTTLIRHLIGLLKAQRGRVTVLGEDPGQGARATAQTDRLHDRRGLAAALDASR